MGRQPHSDECRDRFRDLMKDDAKVRNYNERMKEFEDRQEERKRRSRMKKEKKLEERERDRRRQMEEEDLQDTRDTLERILYEAEGQKARYEQESENLRQAQLRFREHTAEAKAKKNHIMNALHMA